jgi:hypothetical protein
MNIQFLRQRVGIRSFVLSVLALTLLLFAISRIPDSNVRDDCCLAFAFTAGMTLLVLVALAGSLRGNASFRRILIFYGCGFGVVFFCIMLLMPLGVFASFCLLVLAYAARKHIGYCVQRGKPIVKFKRIFWTGWTFAAVTLAYCIAAYIFMWSPVVTYQYPYDAHACENNLRQIDAAIDEFALEHKKHTGDPVTFDDLTPYLKLTDDGKIQSCPEGGKYAVTVIGAEPTCSLNQSHGKSLWQHLSMALFP